MPHYLAIRTLEVSGEAESLTDFEEQLENIPAEDWANLGDEIIDLDEEQRSAGHAAEA